MTILNIALDEERALVVSNTAGWFLDRMQPTMYANKLLLLPAANAVLVGRGPVVGLGNVWAQLFGMMAPFEAMVEALPAAVERAHAMLVAGARAVSLPASMPLGLQVELVGWSNARGSIRAFHCFKDLDAPLEAMEMAGLNLVSPVITSIAPSLDRDVMIAIAREQARQFPGDVAAMGGNIVVAEVTRHSVLVSVLPP